MSWELLSTYLKLPVFALVAARVGGVLMFQPVFSALSIPVQVKALLVVGLAAVLTPLVSLPAAAPDTPLGIALAMGSELLLGFVIGLASMLCFVGLQMGGQLIAQESGLAFGQIANPNSDEEESIVSVFYVQLGVLVFLLIGGHRALVSVCLDTFETIPLLHATGAELWGADLLGDALLLSGQIAVRVAAPTMIALFLVNVAMGFIARTMPQLNIIAVGFSLKAMIAFVLMAVSLPLAGDLFIAAFDEVFTSFQALIGR